MTTVRAATADGARVELAPAPPTLLSVLVADDHTGPLELVEAARRAEPDVVMLVTKDPHAPRLVRLLGEFGSRVMVVATGPGVPRQDCLEAGAAGFVDGDPGFEGLARSLRGLRPGPAAGGGPVGQLTQREREVLAALMDGRAAEDIAKQEFVSLSTVRTQIRSVLLKLGVRSQLAAVAVARRSGWEGELGASPRAPQQIINLGDDVGTCAPRDLVGSP